MYGTGDHHIKQNKSDSEKQILQVFSHTWNLDLKVNDVNATGRLFRGGTSRSGMAKGEGMGNEYDISTLYACMKTV
jgi:hypothetical protein